MNRLLINVNQKHIKTGRKNFKNKTLFRARSCPVALALIDAGVTNAVVLTARAYSDMGNHLLPRSVRRFINRFDHDEPVKPFNFYLV